MVIVNMFQNVLQSEFKQCYAVCQQFKYLPSTDWHRKVCCNSSGAVTIPPHNKDYIQATQSRKPLQCHADTPLKPTHPSTKVLKQ